MSITIETQRTDFYNELSEEKRKEYFSLSRSKFHATIDNIYYGVFVRGDEKENPKFDALIDKLVELKAVVLASHLPVDFAHGLQVTLKSYAFYRFCLTEHDLFDIFIIGGKLPNDGTPRIVVQLRAFGLWTRGIEEILTQSFNRVVALLADYGFEVDSVRENRIDYCYHTNALTSPNKAFNIVRGKVKNLYTNLEDSTFHAKTRNADNGTFFDFDYICMGRIESNNVRARVYDKVKEVIEMGYKSFFFEIWYQNKLINFYDKWCFEYAFPRKSVDWLNRARLAFYIEFGQDNAVKREFELMLKDRYATLDAIKQLADSYMPRTTAVTNIEYETKRKFYYYSDKFIDKFKVSEHYWDKDFERHDREKLPEPLLRLFKILDNRWVFLDYLTSKTLSFHHNRYDDKGNLVFLDWWDRLRKTKLGVDKTDEQFLRDYTHDMDKKMVLVKTINNIASSAVYDDKVDTTFIEDVSDLIANLNDNGAHAMLSFNVIGDNGEVLDDIGGSLLTMYDATKQRKDKMLKNRKKTTR